MKIDCQHLSKEDLELINIIKTLSPEDKTLALSYLKILAKLTSKIKMTELPFKQHQKENDSINDQYKHVQQPINIEDENNLFVKLWSTTNSWGSCSITAEIEDGSLKITGQDSSLGLRNLGIDIEEYRYNYSFDFNNTKKLISLITANGKSIKDVLLSRFGSKDGDEQLREFCGANGVEYKFSSRIL